MLLQTDRHRQRQRLIRHTKTDTYRKLDKHIQAILRWQGRLTLLLPHIPIADALTNTETQTKTKTDK